MSNENFVQAAPGPWKVDSGLGIEDAEGRGVGRVYRHGTRIEGTDTDVATALLGAAPLLLAACEAADLALADILMDAEEFIVADVGGGVRRVERGARYVARADGESAGALGRIRVLGDLLDEHGRPLELLVSRRELTAQEAEAIREEWLARHAGGAAPLAVLPEPARVEVDRFTLLQELGAARSELETVAKDLDAGRPYVGRHARRLGRILGRLDLALASLALEIDSGGAPLAVLPEPARVEPSIGAMRDALLGLYGVVVGTITANAAAHIDRAGDVLGLDPIVAFSPTPLDDVLAEVVAWANTTFGPSTPERKVEHLRREVLELVADPENAEEMADCVMILAHLAAGLGIDLAAAVERKLNLNRRRRWGAPDELGVVEHERGAS